MIELNTYTDEIQEITLKDPVLGDQKWAYIGMLIVPTHLEDELITRLLNKRCGDPAIDVWGQCPNTCRYHGKNNTEVHYKELGSGQKFRIAQQWLKFLLEDKTLTYFYILGINLSNLDYSRFGKGTGAKMAIYNRFFRIAFLKPVKTFFHRYNEIVIKSVVHDNGSQADSPLFPWHVINKIGREDKKVSFACNEITFLDSDHRNSGDTRSHLLQYIDVILGATFNALHWKSHQPDKEQIAQDILPLLERLINEPRNVNSPYNYFGRQSIEFFPRHRLVSNQLINAANRLDSFYTRREIRIHRKTQPSLFAYREVAATNDDL